MLRNRSMGLYKTKKLLHTKGNNQQSEETTYRMIENIQLTRDESLEYSRNSKNSKAEQDSK
jgi:hypothetical protein